MSQYKESTTLISRNLKKNPNQQAKKPFKLPKKHQTEFLGEKSFSKMFELINAISQVNIKFVKN